MDDKRLKASAKSLNKVINASKAGETPCAIIAKVGRGEAISDDEFGILVNLERGIKSLMDLLDMLEKQSMAGN